MNTQGSQSELLFKQDNSVMDWDVEDFDPSAFALNNEDTANFTFNNNMCNNMNNAYGICNLDSQENVMLNSVERNYLNTQEAQNDDENNDFMTQPQINLNTTERNKLDGEFSFNRQLQSEKRYLYNEKKDEFNQFDIFSDSNSQDNLVLDSISTKTNQFLNNNIKSYSDHTFNQNQKDNKIISENNSNINSINGTDIPKENFNMSGANNNKTKVNNTFEMRQLPKNIFETQKKEEDNKNLKASIISSIMQLSNNNNEQQDTSMINTKNDNNIHFNEEESEESDDFSSEDYNSAETNENNNNRGNRNTSKSNKYNKKLNYKNLKPVEIVTEEPEDKEYTPIKPNISMNSSRNKLNHNAKNSINSESVKENLESFNNKNLYKNTNSNSNQNINTNCITSNTTKSKNEIINPQNTNNNANTINTNVNMISNAISPNNFNFDSISTTNYKWNELNANSNVTSNTNANTGTNLNLDANLNFNNSINNNVNQLNMNHSSYNNDKSSLYTNVNTNLVNISKNVKKMSNNPTENGNLNKTNFSEPILLTPILVEKQDNRIIELNESEISNKFDVMKKKLLKLPAEFERINAELNSYSDLEFEVTKLYEDIIDMYSEACGIGNELLNNIFIFNEEIDKIVNNSEDEYSSLMSQKVN